MADYIGRTIDLVHLHGDDEVKEVLLEQTLAPAGTGGSVATGIKKLIQRFVLELFTEKESMPFLAGRGSSFMIKARQGLLRSQLDVFQAFSQAEVEIRTQLRLEEQSTDPNDERYGSATLLSVSFTTSFISMTIRLTSRAAAGTVTFITPLPIPVFEISP